jgi:hypothetical protein
MEKTRQLKQLRLRRLAKLGYVGLGGLAMVPATHAQTTPTDATSLITAAGVLLAAAIAVGITALTWKVGARFISKFVK